MNIPHKTYFKAFHWINRLGESLTWSAIADLIAVKHTVVEQVVIQSTIMWMVREWLEILGPNIG